MDTTDNNNVEFQKDHDYRHLPVIIRITIRVVDYKPPVLKHFISSLADFNKALELIVTTDGPIPIIASSPVLHIGNSAPIPLYEQIKNKENAYRFLAFQWENLKQNDTIYFGWYNDQPAKRIKTKFKFKISD
jgi:hypothetical protein